MRGGFLYVWKGRAFCFVGKEWNSGNAGGMASELGLGKEGIAKEPWIRLLVLTKT